LGWSNNAGATVTHIPGNELYLAGNLDLHAVWAQDATPPPAEPNQPVYVYPPAAPPATVVIPPANIVTVIPGTSNGTNNSNNTNAEESSTAGSQTDVATGTTTATGTTAATGIDAASGDTTTIPQNNTPLGNVTADEDLVKTILLSAILGVAAVTTIAVLLVCLVRKRRSDEE
ncbi:MAG: hypothetical protein LBD25_07960, partial [Coriobacteriales bacterium]|nr:hypothetical protein [Coriobacteriales bacterium]